MPTGDPTCPRCGMMVALCTCDLGPAICVYMAQPWPPRPLPPVTTTVTTCPPSGITEADIRRIAQEVCDEMDRRKKARKGKP